jgi:hypothetical protein
LRTNKFFLDLQIIQNCGIMRTQSFFGDLQTQYMYFWQTKTFQKSAKTYICSLQT